MFAKTSALSVSVGRGEERLVCQQRTVICYNVFLFYHCILLIFQVFANPRHSAAQGKGLFFQKVT